MDAIITILSPLYVSQLWDAKSLFFFWVYTLDLNKIKMDIFLQFTSSDFPRKQVQRGAQIESSQSKMPKRR